MSSQPLTAITNYLSISDRIGTAGQPAREQFADIQAAGYQVVINLAVSASTQALPDERELVAGLGMDYVHIPVVWASPQPGDLDQFFAAMDRYQEHKVFVHCAMNMRVSAFVYLYRVIRQAEPPDAAWGDVLRIWEPDAVWRRFIDDALARSGVHV